MLASYLLTSFAVRLNELKLQALKKKMKDGNVFRRAEKSQSDFNTLWFPF